MVSEDMHVQMVAIILNDVALDNPEHARLGLSMWREETTKRADASPSLVQLGTRSRSREQRRQGT